MTFDQMILVVAVTLYDEETDRRCVERYTFLIGKVPSDDASRKRVRCARHNAVHEAINMASRDSRLTFVKAVTFTSAAATI